MLFVLLVSVPLCIYHTLIGILDARLDADSNASRGVTRWDQVVRRTEIASGAIPLGLTYISSLISNTATPGNPILESLLLRAAQGNKLYLDL